MSCVSLGLSVSVCLSVCVHRHADYDDSAYIYVGGLDVRLTEGDVFTIFSQVCVCVRVCVCVCVCMCVCMHVCVYVLVL